MPTRGGQTVTWLGFGVRDIILLLVALVAVYLVVMLLKLLQLGKHRSSAGLTADHAAERIDTRSPLRRRAEPALPEEADLPEAAPGAAGLGEPASEETAAVGEAPAVPPAPTFEWDEVRELFGTGEAVPAPPRGGGFGEPLSEHLARSEMEMEMQRMRDEMARMRAEVEAMRCARRVSPQYGEAMALAQRGATAQQIADQLGISLGEAELVQALSRGREDFAEGEAHGEDEYATGNRGHDEPARRRAG